MVVTKKKKGGIVIGVDLLSKFPKAFQVPGAFRSESFMVFLWAEIEPLEGAHILQMDFVAPGTIERVQQILDGQPLHVVLW